MTISCQNRHLRRDEFRQVCKWAGCFRPGWVGLVALSVLAIPSNALENEVNAEPTLTVQIRNYSPASSATLAAAEREASRILGEAGVRTLWTECPGKPTDIPSPGPCEAAAKDSDLRLRVTTPVRNTFPAEVFGFSYHPFLASVYYDSVVRRATVDNVGFAVAVLLGCVMAHELGHLLLGPDAHALGGIMLGVWEPRQIQLVLQGNLLFTSRQSKVIRERVRMRLAAQMANQEPNFIPLE